MSEPMIEVDRLTKRFGTFTAVDHVSFSVGKGSIFGFLGPNGSGKTTLIRMLCGILEPSDGTARIGGHDIVRDAEPIKEMIGYMSKLIVCGEPHGLKTLPEMNPPGTRRLDVTCDHVTTALHAMHDMPGVRSATVFGQSMHLLVDDTVKRAQIDEQLRKVGVSHAEIHEMGPSLEDVFVELSAKHAAEQQKAA